MDLTQEEFKAAYLTLKQPSGDRTEAYLGRHYYNGADLPDEIDWSTKGAVTDIKDQGQCGSCWAFSTVGSLEGRTFTSTGSLPNLSEQQFVDCDTDFGDQGCNGGLMDNAFQYAMQSGGICTESNNFSQLLQSFQQPWLSRHSQHGQPCMAKCTMVKRPPLVKPFTMPTLNVSSTTMRMAPKASR